MTEATLSALPLTLSDELESPARRALRRLFKRKGAVAGLVVLGIVVATGMLAVRLHRSGPPAAAQVPGVDEPAPLH